MKDNFSKFSLPLLWIFAFLIIIFMMPFVSHAEDSAYFPMLQNENNKFPDYLKDYLNTQFDYENNYIFAAYSSEEWSYSTKHSYYYVCYFSKQYNDGVPFIYGEINNNGYIFGLYKYPVYSLTAVRVRMSEVYSSGNLSSYTFRINNTYGDNLANFQNFTSSVYSTDSSFVSNFRMFVNNQENADVVLKYGPDPIPPLDIGTAIVPPAPFIPEYPNGSTPPSQVPPSYTPTDYQWTTPPVFDSSSIENAIGSIQNTLGWIANNLKEEFKNLTDNGKHFFEYIGKTIQYYGNAIIETLNNAIQNFYDNMAALVQPIFEKIAYITEPVDSAAISSAINNTSFVGIKSQFSTFFTTFESAFDISEPSTFTLTINIQNVSTFYNFGCRSPVIIHLDEHFIPIRTALRTFLWIMISFGTVFVIERGLSDWLRGENDTK